MSRMAGIGIIAATITLVGAGCGSDPSDSSTPAGLVTSSRNATAEHAASATLTPQPGSFLDGKSTVTALANTSPANGDSNPYAALPVSRTVGSVTAGDVLVSNFNNKSNNQGTGTTIVAVHPDKSVTVFADVPADLPGCPGGVGLTTAMVQLSTGWVLVGSLPTKDGKIATSGSGCLVELSPTGAVAGTIAGPYLNGPWDAALVDNGDTATLFVSNTLAGVREAGEKTVDKGTVVRLSLAQTMTEPPTVTATTEVAGGFPERADAAALVKGPTGVAVDAAGTLYVGDNLNNRIAAVPNALTRADSAGTGTTLSDRGQLANPLAVRIAPNGNILAANATNGKIIEITPTGRQVGAFYANHDVAQSPPGNGNLFGMAVTPAADGVLFVNDDTNTLSVLHQ